MKGLQIQDQGLLPVHGDIEVIGLKDFAYCVYMVNGTVEEVAPATGLRLTATHLVFVLGEFVVARLPRKEVYFVAEQPTAPPVLF